MLAKMIGKSFKSPSEDKFLYPLKANDNSKGVRQPQAVVTRKIVESFNIPISEHQAWCLALEQRVSAAEAWELLYGLKSVRHDLSFKCLDPACSARLILRNCYAHTAPTDAQFRLYPRDKHIAGCSYSDIKRQHKNSQMRKEARRQRFQELKHPLRGQHVYSY